MGEWIPIIVSVIAVAVSIFTASREYRFGKPDALAKYEDLVNELIAKNEKLTARVDCLEQELEDYRLGVVILITQMEAAGVQPKWKPKASKRGTGELKGK